MINEHGTRMGDALSVAAGGFESTGHPHWVIERKSVDPVGLVPPSWNDAFRYYDPERNYENGRMLDYSEYYYSRPVQYYPEDLRLVLNRLREMFPAEEFRMVMRVEMQKALDF